MAIIKTKRVEKSKSNSFKTAAHELLAAGSRLHAMGLVPATSGNLSCRLPKGEVAITASGAHKGYLTEKQILKIDASGRALGTIAPSAETGLHLQLYRRFPEVEVVLHHHSLMATLISRTVSEALVLRGYEMLKALGGTRSHEAAVVVPVFANDQNIARLTTRVENCLSAEEPLYGYLIAGHGFYTWGNSMDQALRHVEAFEFLFECEWHLHNHVMSRS